MKILVCISKTPETTAKIAFKENDSQFDENGVQFIMNPYDEWYALVRACEIKEAQGGTVTAICVGEADCDVIIRKALAIGADDAIRVDAAPRDAMFVAKQIASQAQGYDLILTGKETINYNGSLVGAMISEYMELPYISYGTQLEIADGKAKVTRDIEGGSESSETPLPVVVSAAKGMAEQRIPNMRGIMMAKRKPLNIVPPVDAEKVVGVTNYALPSGKGSVKMIDPDNMDELVRLLKEEAKVL